MVEALALVVVATAVVLAEAAEWAAALAAEVEATVESSVAEAPEVPAMEEVDIHMVPVAVPALPSGEPPRPVHLSKVEGIKCPCSSPKGKKHLLASSENRRRPSGPSW